MSRYYGIDVDNLFTLRPLSYYQKQVPSSLYKAKDFLDEIRIDYERHNELLGVFQDIYQLNNLDTTEGIYLDMRGAEVGAYRDGRDDAQFRAYIRIIMSLNKLNSGTIPDIRQFVRNVFTEEYSSKIPITDNKNGSVSLIIPSSVPSEILEGFADVSDILVAAGILLRIATVSVIEVGLEVSSVLTKVVLEDKERALFIKRKRFSAGRRMAKYVSRFNVGLDAPIVVTGDSPVKGKLNSEEKMSSGRKFNKFAPEGVPGIKVDSEE